MKHFAKIALVSAIAMSSSAFAMEAMEDEALSETTGQDGVTVSIQPPAAGITFSTVIHDSNGFTGATSAGAIVFGNATGATGTGLGHIVTNIDTPGTTTIDLLIDATGDIDAGTAGNQAALNIDVTIPTGTTIQTGTLSAARSTGAGLALTDPTGVIMDNMTLTLGATNLDITLGNEVATTGQMIRVNTTMTGGLDITNFALRDANGGGTGGSAIRAATVAIDDAGAGTNLTVDARIDVVPTGLQINLVTMGTGGTDISMGGFKLGDTAAVAIGAVDIIGLNMSGTLIRVGGH